jgi:hypothetical protein
MKKVLLFIISSFFLTAAMAMNGIDLRYTNHTSYATGLSSDRTINVMADIGDSITLTVENAVTALDAWKFNRVAVSAADVNPFTVTVTQAGVYSVNTNSALGVVYFYVCVSNSSRPLAPPPIVGSTTNCSDAVYPANSYHMDGLSVLPYCTESFQWIAPTGATVVTSNNGLEATVTFGPSFVSGYLRVRATTTAGVSRETKMFIVCANYNSRRLTAEEAEETSMVNVFPNPFVDKLNVTTNSNDTYTLTLSDITGKVIASQFITGSGTLDAMPFPKGYYFYTLYNGGGPVKRGRIMKQ